MQGRTNSERVYSVSSPEPQGTGGGSKPAGRTGWRVTSTPPFPVKNKTYCILSHTRYTLAWCVVHLYHMTHKSSILHVRLTPEVIKLASGRAEALGLGLSEWVRGLVVAGLGDLLGGGERGDKGVGAVPAGRAVARGKTGRRVDMLKEAAKVARGEMDLVDPDVDRIAVSSKAAGAVEEVEGGVPELW